MKEVLIVNLTRMGDLVQTTPVMTGLKDRYPGVRITLLVNSMFAEICNYMPFVDRAVAFDVSEVIEKLHNGKLVSCFHYIEDVLRKINDATYDLAVNFTHSSVSAILMSLIKAKEMRGLSADEEGHSVKRHPWIRYFFNVIPGREYNPFHLCDMYVKTGGALPREKGLYLSVHEDGEEWARTTLQNQGVGLNDLLIGVQLGASSEDKRWHIESFAELSDRLTETFGARILLIGSAKEVSLGKEFETIARFKPLNFIGKTDLKELAALLKRCNLLVSNDTGPLHIATAVGTTVIDISLASVHFRETGPYGEGHYVIAAEIPCSPCNFQTSCRDMVCKEAVNVNNVFELVRRLLTEKALTTIDDHALWHNIQVYRSYFEIDGLIGYRPLIKRPLSKEMLFMHIYRETWLKILDGASPDGLNDTYQRFLDKLYNWYDINSINTSPLIEDEINALTRLKGLADIGFSKVTLIVKEARKSSPDIRWIKEAWKDVPMIDREIEIIGNTCDPLLPMTIMFRYGKESLEGKDLVMLAEETRILYNDLKNHVSIMLRFIGRWAQMRDIPSVYEPEMNETLSPLFINYDETSGHNLLTQKGEDNGDR